MSNADELARLQEQLAAHRATLAHQLTQRAHFSAGHVPAHLAHGIAQARAAIAQLKADLRGRGVAVDDQPGDVAGPEEALLSPPDPAAAQAQLATMPLDVVPASAKTLPPGSRMTYNPNPLFTGRETELLALAAALKSGDANVISTGIGGVGKTTLAIEAAWRYGQFFLGGVFWVRCAEAVNIPSEIAACGGPGALQLQGFAGRPQSEQVQAVLAEWARDIPRLLIFDNCEDPELLREYRPKGGGSRVLVTSRNAVWPPTLGAATLALDVLSLDESIALLRRLCARLTDDEAAQVAEALGRLPLALHLAGSFLERYGTPVTDYLNALTSPTLLDHPSMIGRGLKDRPAGRDLHVAKAFALSFDLLDKADPIDAAALALLARAACLAPGEPFPRILLEDSLPIAEGDEAAALDRTDGLARLLELGLLERAGDDALKLHRLLARYAARVVDDAEAQGAVAKAITATGVALVSAGFLVRLTSIVSHMRHVWAVTKLSADEDAAALAGALGRVEQGLTNYASAKQLYKCALVISENVLGSEHPDTAGRLNDLALLLTYEGNFVEARSLFKRALTINEQVMGPDHSDTLGCLNNLALLLISEKSFVEARSLCERVLASTEREFGPDHPNLATALNNLAGVFESQGDHVAALPLYKRALVIREQVLGEEHADTALSLNNMGNLFYQLGDYVEAKSLYERALAIRERLLGPEHPITASTLGNIAHLLSHQEDYAGARSLYERALVIFEQAMGQDHSSTIASLTNLVIILQRQRKYAELVSIYERALTISERVLQQDFLDTPVSLINLAGLFYNLEDYFEARPLYERALAIRERVLGPDHPDTHWVRENLAALDAQLGLVE